MLGPPHDEFESLGPEVGGGRVYRTARQINLPSLTIPRGTIFDVSVPLGLRWLMDPHDPRLLLAAAAHDHALRLGHGRIKAAVPFNEALRIGGMRRVARLVIVLAVIVWKFR